MEQKVEKYNKFFEKEEKKKLTERFHPKDDLLSGITFEDLLDTVDSNEPVVDERAVQKVFNEILQANLLDAKAELKDNMREIIKYIGR